jgi:hypothetical protein
MVNKFSRVAVRAVATVVTAAACLSLLPQTAFAHTSEPVPLHTVNLNVLWLCSSTCSTSVSVPYTILAWNRTPQVDSEVVSATARYWLYDAVNRKWVAYDQSWSYAAAWDNSSPSPSMWLDAYNNFKPLFGIYNVARGTYYQIEYWIYWPSMNKYHIEKIAVAQV